jgi:hypothetical protein
MRFNESTTPGAQRDIYAWPEGVAMSVPALQRARAQGDAPRLYAVTERKLVTTGADLLEWIRAKAVPPGYKCRPAVRRRDQAAA